MSVLYPSPAKLEALRARWEGQEERLARVAATMLEGGDWTLLLAGLPFIREIPPLPGDALGRDLRGADLRHLLRPEIHVKTAAVEDAPVIAAITYEAMRSNTALPGASPFPADLDGAEEMALLMRRGETFLIARCAERPVGVVRIDERNEFRQLTGQQAYLEVSGLAVLPPYRLSGVGTALLDAAEQLAADESFANALLRTTFNEPPTSLKERRGYVVEQVRQLASPGPPTILDVVMVKRLQSRSPLMRDPRRRTAR